MLYSAVWKTNTEIYFYSFYSFILEQKWRALTLPGDGCQAVEVPPCTSLLSNKGTQSHGSLWKCFFLLRRWYSSLAESLEDLMERASKWGEKWKNRKRDGLIKKKRGGKKKCINWRCQKQVTGILGIMGRVVGEGGWGRLVDRRGEKLAEEREKERLKWPALVLRFFSGGNSFSPTLRCFLWKIYSPHFSPMWDLKEVFLGLWRLHILRHLLK